MLFEKNNFQGLDLTLISATIGLVLFGLIMVFSSTTMESFKYGNMFYYLNRQLIFLAMGIFAFIFAVRTDHKNYGKWSGQILIASIFLLSLVYVPFLGKSVNGAVRWIDLGFFSFQPSEFAKLAVVIYMADVLARKGERISDFIKGIFPLLVTVMVICIFIILQPDLGTVLVILGTVLIMLFIAGSQLKHMLGLFAATAAGVAALSILAPYRMQRLLAFIDPWKDPQGISYQIVQSLIAVGSGGLFGLGIGASRQKFLYLPQSSTDFIFAIICEELGLIGATILIALFFMLIKRGIVIARKTTARFGLLLASGITASIALQVIINISVVTGLAPTTGIPLPFISYGGTSLIISLFCVGVLVNISKADQSSEVRPVLRSSKDAGGRTKEER